MRFLSWIFLSLLAVLVIILSVGNREAVTFSLFPLPFVMEIPLFILILGGAFLGVLLGALKTWMVAGRNRQENRANRREIKRLHEEIDRLQREVARSEATSSTPPVPENSTAQRQISAG